MKLIGKLKLPADFLGFEDNSSGEEDILHSALSTEYIVLFSDCQIQLPTAAYKSINLHRHFHILPVFSTDGLCVFV